MVALRHICTMWLESLPEWRRSGLEFLGFEPKRVVLLLLLPRIRRAWPTISELTDALTEAEYTHAHLVLEELHDDVVHDLRRVTRVLARGFLASGISETPLDELAECVLQAFAKLELYRFTITNDEIEAVVDTFLANNATRTFYTPALLPRTACDPRDPSEQWLQNRTGRRTWTSHRDHRPRARCPIFRHPGPH